MLNQDLNLKLYLIFFGKKCITHSLRGKKIFENAREILSRQNFLLLVQRQCYEMNSRDKLLFKFQCPWRPKHVFWLQSSMVLLVQRLINLSDVLRARGWQRKLNCAPWTLPCARSSLAPNNSQTKGGEKRIWMGAGQKAVSFSAQCPPCHRSTTAQSPKLHDLYELSFAVQEKVPRITQWWF